MILDSIGTIKFRLTSLHDYRYLRCMNDLGSWSTDRFHVIHHYLLLNLTLFTYTDKAIRFVT